MIDMTVSIYQLFIDLNHMTPVSMHHLDTAHMHLMILCQVTVFTTEAPVLFILKKYYLA